VADEYEPEEDDSPVVQLRRNQIRSLESKAKKADELEAQVAELQRRAVLSEAGVPDTPIGKLFKDAYKGDLTTEAVKAAMVEYGIASGTEAVSAAEQAAHQRIASADSGQGPSDGAIDAADALRNAKSEQEVLAILDALKRG
jgi:hypothetical protein